MTSEEFANWVTIIGLPLILIQFILADRARVAEELVGLHVAVSEAAIAASVADDVGRESKTILYLNLLDSCCSLVNCWTVSIWTRSRWRKFLVSSICELACAPAHLPLVKTHCASNDAYKSIKFFCPA